MRSGFRLTGYLLLAMASFASLGCESSLREPSELEKNLHIHSLHTNNLYVFAINHEGMFRANLKSKVWEKLTLPEPISPHGWFGATPRDSHDVLYVTQDLHNYPGDYTHGIYLSRDAGMTWRLLSNEHPYDAAILLNNGKLYTCYTPWLDFEIDRKRQNPKSSDVLMSEDLGKTWRSIYNNAGGIVANIEPDPDNPNLIRLETSTLMPYLWAAKDEQYEWEHIGGPNLSSD